MLPGGLVERRETTGQHDVLIYNNLVEELKALTSDQANHQAKHTEEMNQIENIKSKTDGKIAVLEEQFQEVHSKILQESLSRSHVIYSQPSQIIGVYCIVTLQRIKNFLVKSKFSSKFPENKQNIAS